MKKVVICDECGKELDADNATATLDGMDLCHPCHRKQELYRARRDREWLADWLDKTKLKDLRELDEKIKRLESSDD